MQINIIDIPYSKFLNISEAIVDILAANGLKISDNTSIVDIEDKFIGTEYSIENTAD